MAVSSRKIKIGDVMEVHTRKGLAYAHYIGKHAEYGDVIRVLSCHHEHRPTDLDSVIGGRGFLAFYPAKAAVAQGRVEVVDTSPVPAGVEVPKHFRRRGAIDRTGKVLTWIVEHDGKETVHEKLTDVERQLPIAAIWNHEFLITRICEGWSPEQEG